MMRPPISMGHYDDRLDRIGAVLLTSEFIARPAKPLPESNQTYRIQRVERRAAQRRAPFGLRERARRGHALVGHPPSACSRLKALRNTSRAIRQAALSVSVR